MAALSTLLPVFFMLALGFASRILGWITPEQKAGANSILFGVLFPILIFNLMAGANFDLGVLPIVGYVAVMYLLGMLVLGPLTVTFTGSDRAHFSKYLLVTHEGGNVALPLYKNDKEPGFTSAFMSLYIIVTLVVYTLVVLLLA